MRFSRRFLAIACTFTFLSPLAVAQEPGPYISGSLGVTQMRDADLTGTGINTSADYDHGYVVSGALGKAFDNNWRAEGEISFSKSDVDSTGGASGRGDTSAVGLMFNGYYDFRSDSLWTPYVGAGLGPVSVSYNNVSPVGGSVLDDNDWGIGYQAIAGVSYKMSDQANLYSEYRYVGSSRIDLATDAGASVEGDWSEHRIMVGLRWSFSKPKPVPTPTPVPVPVAQVEPEKPAPVVKPVEKPAPPPEILRNYLVFFDWDKYELTEEVRAILAQAVINSRKVRVTALDVVGHTDRSGTDAYNVKLSQRRAEAVQAELIKLGIPESEISVQWRGERETLVPTADGVREPQNRRVEIILN